MNETYVLLVAGTVVGVVVSFLSIGVGLLLGRRLAPRAIRGLIGIPIRGDELKAYMDKTGVSLLEALEALQRGKALENVHKSDLSPDIKEVLNWLIFR